MALFGNAYISKNAVNHILFPSFTSFPFFLSSFLSIIFAFLTVCSLLSLNIFAFFAICFTFLTICSVSSSSSSSSSVIFAFLTICDIIKQTIQGARILLTWVVFSKTAMVCSQTQKKRVIDKIIKESVLQFYRPNNMFLCACVLLWLIFAAVFQSFITTVHRKQVTNALSAKRGKVIDFAQEGVTTAFRLFPPQGHTSLPDEFHTASVSALIQGTDPLLFMHNFYFDENYNTIVRMHFQNSFMMTNLKAIKNVSCVAGAAMYCALFKQGRTHLETQLFSGRAHIKKFRGILAAIDGLTGAEKDDFEEFLHYVLAIGLSQTRGNGEEEESELWGKHMGIMEQ
ncbi:hypothetical protein P692DRAFT_20875282 [Suillus brevipes Sb2]|nr:hypothetical protein P692DRAFT_20875282 [Suillus brevipes Sb2]